MTVEQKVGQMIQAEIANATPDDARAFGLGAILNGGGSSPGGDKHANVDDWLALADAYFAASRTGREPDLAIPILWGTDAVHGHSNVFRATVFPHNIGLGAAHGGDLIRAIGEATAREVTATGLDWTFAPTLAVVRDDRWGRTYEGYSEDPGVVADYAPRMVGGLQGNVGDDDFLGAYRVLATSKHFLGEGATSDGRDQGDATCSEATLCDVHGAGHRAAIATGAQVVMAAYNSWHDTKVHGHRYLLTDVLKGAMQFDGFVVSDWNGPGTVRPCCDSTASLRKGKRRTWPSWCSGKTPTPKAMAIDHIWVIPRNTPNRSPSSAVSKPGACPPWRCS